MNFAPLNKQIKAKSYGDNGWKGDVMSRCLNMTYRLLCFVTNLGRILCKTKYEKQVLSVGTGRVVNIAKITIFASDLLCRVNQETKTTI